MIRNLCFEYENKEFTSKIFSKEVNWNFWTNICD